MLVGPRCVADRIAGHALDVYDGQGSDFRLCARLADERIVSGAGVPSSFSRNTPCRNARTQILRLVTDVLAIEAERQVAAVADVQ